MNKNTRTSNDMSTLAEDARALMAATADVAGEKVGEALTGNQRQILILLCENPRMAAREVAQRIGYLAIRSNRTLPN